MCCVMWRTFFATDSGCLQADAEVLLLLIGAPSLAYVGYGVCRWRFEAYDSLVSKSLASASASTVR